MKILIVDDDRSRVASLKNYLISEHPDIAEKIHTAECVNEAESLLSRFHFEVLILDVVLPKDSNKGSKVDSKHGLNLLTSLTRQIGLKKPSKIIGITAHLDDLGRFRKSFEKFCFVVIEANRRSIGWKKKLSDYIDYDQTSNAHRQIDTQSLNVITIHGIRTYGEWQHRLEKLANHELMPIPFHAYKYGYASFFALFSRARHEKELEFLASRLLKVFADSKSSKFVVFSHSFGTFLLIETLRCLAEQGVELPILSVVLSGSVLRNSVDLTFLTERGIKVINDCGDQDFVLWLSEAFIPHLGMAGKTGILGFENESLINRFCNGGHSSYFDGDEYMRRYWLPLLNTRNNTEKFDFRESSTIRQDFCERLIMSIGAAKHKLVNVNLWIKLKVFRLLRLN